MTNCVLKRKLHPNCRCNTICIISFLIINVNLKTQLAKVK